MNFNRIFFYLVLIPTVFSEAIFSPESTTIENYAAKNSTRENQTDSNEFESIRFASILENVTIQNGVAIEAETTDGIAVFDSVYAVSEPSEIFTGTGNGTDVDVTAKEVRNETKSVDYACEENSFNGTGTCNRTTMALKSGSATEYPSFMGTVDVVAVAAGLCLILAIAGYFSCVGYRRYHERKYGNSQIVAREDVYDTTDLKYFEI